MHFSTSFTLAHLIIALFSVDYVNMSLNFVGSITVMDRGDAPAQAVLDRNARSLAKRVSDETKNELGKVLKRVDQVTPTCKNIK